MRRRLAQILAAFTSLVILVLSALFAYVQQQRLPAADAAPPSAATPEGEMVVLPGPADPDDDEVAERRVLERGKQVYEEQRCSACHSIGGAGNRRNPLDGVGSALDREMLRRWIVDPRSVDPKVWKPSYKDLPTADLDALVEYLGTLIDSDEERQ